jgi:hypothetical protein
MKRVVKNSSEKEPEVRTNFKRESFESIKARMQEKQLEDLSDSEEEE